MPATPNLFTVLTDPTGALLYFLAAIAVSQAALFMALGQRLRGPGERSAGHYTLAGLLVIAFWVALLGGALVALLTHTPVIAVLPPLERAVDTLIILIIGWAFVSADAPDSARLLTVGGLLLGVAIIVGFAFTEDRWLPAPTGGFNANSFGAAWAGAGLGLAILYALVVLLRARRVMDVPLKLIFFVLLAVGYGLTLYLPRSGDDPGAIRLAFLVALPIWPVVVYRLVTTRFAQEIEASRTRTLVNAKAANNASPATPDTAITAVSESSNDRESVSVLKALGGMLERDLPEELPRQIVTAVASALKADLVALLVLDDAEYADVIAAYDNIQQKFSAAMAIKIDEQPTLMEALQTPAQRALLPEDKLNELVDLYTRLDVQRTGPAYFQPLTRDGKSIAALVIGLPYSQRQLRPSEAQLLTALAPIAARLLSIGRAAHRSRTE